MASSTTRPPCGGPSLSGKYQATRKPASAPRAAPRAGPSARREPRPRSAGCWLHEARTGRCLHGDEVHVPLFDAGQQQIVHRPARARHVGQEPVDSPAACSPPSAALRGVGIAQQTSRTTIDCYAHLRHASSKPMSAYQVCRDGTPSATKCSHRSGESHASAMQPNRKRPEPTWWARSSRWPPLRQAAACRVVHPWRARCALARPAGVPTASRPPRCWWREDRRS